MRRWLPILLWLPLLAGGCVTHKLWTESEMDEWNEPAGDPNLRLFRAERQKDVLVVYDEYSERREAIQARAFFLYQNQARLQPRGHPHFVDLDAARGLPPVPLFFSTPANPPELYGVITQTNRGSFAVVSAGRRTGPYVLPMYADGWGRVEKIAWTPFAVTADVTIVGGVLGCLWIYSGGPGLNR